MIYILFLEICLNKYFWVGFFIFKVYLFFLYGFLWCVRGSINILGFKEELFFYSISIFVDRRSVGICYIFYFFFGEYGIYK